MQKIFFILILPFFCFSQKNVQYFFKGNINLNNNGIDWVPLFSRGKPSLITNFSLGKDRFSINPLIRYELEGFQPWGIDIWWNYKIKQKGKFNFDIGVVFPGVINQRITVIDKNLPNKILQPWVTTIINPNFSYVFNQSFVLSLSYYEETPLKIVNKNQIKSNRIIILAASMRQILITDKIYLSWIPIIYTIQIEDTKTGIFSAQTINIGLLNYPFSISSVINKPLNFGGLTGKRFDWNIGLNYSFDLKFIKAQKNKYRN